MALTNLGYIKDGNKLICSAQALKSSSGSDTFGPVLFDAAGVSKVVVIANTDIVIPDTKVLKIEPLLGVSTSSFADSLSGTVIYNVTASGETTIKAGTVLASWVIPAEIPCQGSSTYRYVGLKVSVTSDMSAYKIDAFVTV